MTENRTCGCDIMFKQKLLVLLYILHIAYAKPLTNADSQLVLPQDLFSSLSCILTQCENQETLSQENRVMFQFQPPRDLNTGSEIANSLPIFGIPDDDSGPLIVLLGEKEDTNETEFLSWGMKSMSRNLKTTALFLI